MDTMEKETLSPHQAWQEVKKIQRFLNALDQTEEVLKVLAEYDAMKAKLMSEIPVLEKQAADIDEEMSKAEKRLEDIKATYEKTKADIIAAHKNAEQQSQEAKAQMGKQLEEMKNQAKGHVEAMRMELAKLQPEVAKLQSEKRDLEKAIEGLKKQASDQVNSLVGAFKTLGS